MAKAGLLILEKGALYTVFSTAEFTASPVKYKPGFPITSFIVSCPVPCLVLNLAQPSPVLKQPRQNRTFSEKQCWPRLDFLSTNECVLL